MAEPPAIAQKAGRKFRCCGERCARIARARGISRARACKSHEAARDFKFLVLRTHPLELESEKISRRRRELAADRIRQPRARSDFPLALR